MAEGFAAAVYAIGEYLGSITIVGYAAEIGTVLYYAAAIAASTAYSNSQRRRAARQARDNYNASLEDRLVMVSLAGGQRSRVYGRVRNVEGVLFKATRGANSEFYTLVISLAGHAVAAIETIYFDDVPVTLDGNGWVQTAPWMRSPVLNGIASQTYGTGGAKTMTLPNAPIAGSVSVSLVNGTTTDNSTYYTVTPSVSGSVVSFTLPTGGDVTVQYQYVNSTPKARVRQFLGGPSQNLSSILLPLFPSLLTANDKFAGDACLVVDLEFDQDAFPTGVPQITAVMRGANDVYDPRTGTAGWTENPALIARDWAYYQFGGNMPAGTVRNADVIASANACAVSTTFNTAGGPVVKPLFTCGIVCRTDQDPSQSFDEIIESMAGRSGWSGGELRMRAGVYRAPVALTLTEDWLSGLDAITVVGEGPVDEAINIIQPTIADAAQGYAVAPAPDVRAEAYITLDGRELPQPQTFGGVTDVYHAQHVAGILLREARSACTVTLPCNMRAFPLEQFDVIPVVLPHFGWSSKLFEVANWVFSPSGGVMLTLRETGASIFDLAATFDLSDATPNTQLPNPFNVPTPTGVAIASGTAWLLRQKDGTISSRMHVSWTPITDAAVVAGGRIEIRYGLANTPESTWTTLDVPGGDSQIDIDGVQDGAIYIVKLRARNSLVRGQWATQFGHQVIGKTAAPVNVSGLAATVVQGGVRFAWTLDSEVDFAETELRLGSSWAVATPLFRGAANTWTWLSPPLGSFTVLAKNYDTTGNESALAASVAVVVDANVLLQWANLDGIPTGKIYNNLIDPSWWAPGATMEWNLNQTDAGENSIVWGMGPKGSMQALWQCQQMGLAVSNADGGWESGTLATTPKNAFKVDTTKTYRFVVPVYRVASGAGLAYLGIRSGTVCTLNTATPEGNPYFVAGGDGPCPPGRWVLAVGYVFPAGATGLSNAGAGFYDMTTGALIAAGVNYNWASSTVESSTRAYQYYASTGQLQRFGYPMVHIVDGSEPSLRELLQPSAVFNSNQQWVDVGGAGRPSDNSTSDLSLLARVNCVVVGNSASKVGGTGAWDSDVFSRDSYTGGCYASAVFAQTNCDLMFGLNSDPTTDASYTSLDYAMYGNGAGDLYAYESGAGVYLGTYAAADVGAVLYDGAKVYYLKNGTVLRSIAAPPNLKLFFDSSFFQPGARMTNIRFGPQSAVTGIGTGQLAIGAATEVVTFADAAGVVASNLT